MRNLAIVLAILAAPGVAVGDSYETSVDVGASFGMARVTDPQSQSSAAAPALGAAARFSWATRDWLQWDVTGFGMWTAVSLEHRRAQIEGIEVDFDRRAAGVGLEAGVTLRLGARFIPTVGVALGPQLHVFPDTQIILAGGGAPLRNSGVDVELDVGARVSVGFDWRASDRLIVGARGAARASLALGASRWTSLDATVHLSYAWYPRWWLL